MLILNKEKENELEKYGFEKEYTNVNGSNFYCYKKCLTIYSCNHIYKGKILAHSFSKECQDVLYELIKAEVLIQVPNEAPELKEKKIATLKKNIEKMQEKLKALENDNGTFNIRTI